MRVLIGSQLLRLSWVSKAISEAFQKTSQSFRRFQKGFRGLHKLSGKVRRGFRENLEAFQGASKRSNMFHGVSGGLTGIQGVTRHLNAFQAVSESVRRILVRFTDSQVSSTGFRGVSRRSNVSLEVSEGSQWGLR